MYFDAWPNCWLAVSSLHVKTCTWHANSVTCGDDMWSRSCTQRVAKPCGYVVTQTHSLACTRHGMTTLWVGWVVQPDVATCHRLFTTVDVHLRLFLAACTLIMGQRCAHGLVHTSNALSWWLQSWLSWAVLRNLSQKCGHALRTCTTG